MKSDRGSLVVWISTRIESRDKIWLRKDHGAERYALIFLLFFFLSFALIHSALADYASIKYQISRDALNGTITFECKPSKCEDLKKTLTRKLQFLNTVVENADQAIDGMHRMCFADLKRCQQNTNIINLLSNMNTTAVELRTQWIGLFKSEIMKWNALQGKSIKLSTSFIMSKSSSAVCGRPIKETVICPNIWSEVQKRYKQTEEMVELIAYRRRLTDALIAQMALEVLKDIPSIKDLPFWQVEPSGSYSYTSDLDVTIVGLDAALAVQKFNMAFRQHFGKESGILLDSNIYADPFTPTERRDPRVKAIMNHPDGDPSKQDSLALIKLRRYMTWAEWKSFHRKLASMPSPANEVHGKRLERAETLYNDYVDTLYNELGGKKSKPTSFPKKERFIKNCEKGTAKCQQEDHMRASNVCYARKLNAFRIALKDLIEIPPESRSNTDYDTVKEALGIANIYANEAYISQGPHLHVLGLLQAPEGPRKDEIRNRITNQQLLASINEQLGDALKDVEHYTDNFPKAVYRCAKYLDRLRHGLVLIQENAQQHGASPARALLIVPIDTLLIEINKLDIDALLEIRNGRWKPDGQTEPATDEQKSREAKRLAKTVARDQNEFRAWIVSLAMEINAGVRPFLASDGVPN